MGLFDVLYIINYFTYHQDFTIRGKSPMIEIFDDRIEITNPGTPHFI